jgi:beta-N-acetylhexosaminidase
VQRPRRAGYDLDAAVVVVSGPRRLAGIALAMTLAAGTIGAAPGAPSASAAATPTIAQLIGQKLVVRMEGTTPSADLLGRIERGEVGGVILFGPNLTTAPALRALTARLQAAAAAGGRPRLLIAVDQEGGSVKRIPWAPPTLSPPQMGALASTSIARSQGAATGAALLDLGIDVDFGPVADVPVSSTSFMERAGRTWSRNASRTAWLANAFAQGLRFRGVAPTLKHFPGIGLATTNTDTSVVRITASRAALAPGLLPYRLAVSNGLPLIMLSNATYPAWDAVHAAGWSPTIVRTLLRDQLGFRGATITDSLDGTARVRGISVRRIAAAAARAGTDLILTTGSEASTRAVYAYLVAEATAGSIPSATLQASYARILALKAGR